MTGLIMKHRCCMPLVHVPTAYGNTEVGFDSESFGLGLPRALCTLLRKALSMSPSLCIRKHNRSQASYASCSERSACCSNMTT